MITTEIETRNYGGAMSVTYSHLGLKGNFCFFCHIANMLYFLYSRHQWVIQSVQWWYAA